MWEDIEEAVAARRSIWQSSNFAPIAGHAPRPESPTLCVYYAVLRPMPGLLYPSTKTTTPVASKLFILVPSGLFFNSADNLRGEIK